MNPEPRPQFPPDHDPQEGPTMREVRRIRAEVYQESLGRTPEQQRKVEEELAKKYGLQLRPPRKEDDHARQTA